MQDSELPQQPGSTNASVSSRRPGLLREGLIFFTLTLITIALFAVTLLLFRSFSAHRTALAHQFTAQGLTALAASRPADAVLALRTALEYAPDERSDQLLLAQALGEAGRTEESTQYFLTLWDMAPGDGFINLELARLARSSNHMDDAIQYYRASIYGSWQSNAVDRRRGVRMELLHYLEDQHDFTTARSELLIAASNAAHTPAAEIEMAIEFTRIGDLSAALTWYGKAISDDPRNPLALDGAGQTAAQLNDAPHAMDYLQRALEAAPRRSEPRLTESQRTADAALLKQLQETEIEQRKAAGREHRSR
ncbi:MAG TPA: tetratricopeptide repeat protein [Acidobacteriaceae bacterium]